MTRTIISVTAAALLSVAASGAASGKASSPSYSLLSEGMGGATAAPQRDFADRGFKTAYTLLELLNPGSGNAVRKQKPGTLGGTRGKTHPNRRPPSAAVRARPR